MKTVTSTNSTTGSKKKEDKLTACVIRLELPLSHSHWLSWWLTINKAHFQLLPHTGDLRHSKIRRKICCGAPTIKLCINRHYVCTMQMFEGLQHSTDVLGALFCNVGQAPNGSHQVHTVHQQNDR